MQLFGRDRTRIHNGFRSAAGLVFCLMAVTFPKCPGWAERQAQSAPPSIAAARIAVPPVIDGVLEEACWREAAHIDGFWRQRLDAAELERTEAWICCDQARLYVAFRCHDSQPSGIRANQRKRQGDIEDDDWVQMSLDAENAGVNFYQFALTPAGTQWDSVPGGTSEKIEWRGDWHGAAQTDEVGWTAEMAIPFSILRYPRGQDTFRIYLSRHLARERDVCHWPPCYARRQDGADSAYWTNMVTPPPQFRYVLMPYLLSVASERKDDRESLAGGLDLKGTFPNGVVALATYQPDFRNIEDVVETLDFTYTERLLPEYRPFFQEGGEYFPPSALFYSRRVRELDWGAKAFGTVGSEMFGVLDTYRRGGENHLVWSYEHLLGTRGGIGFSGVDRRAPGDPLNRVGALAGHREWPFAGGEHYAYARTFWSRTEGVGGDDTVVEYGAGTEREQGWEWRFSHKKVGPEFEADDGFVPERGIRRTSGGINYRRSYDDSAVLRRDYWAHYNFGSSPWGGRHQLWVEHDIEWRNGRTVWVGGDRNTRDGFESNDAYAGTGWNRRDIYRAGGIDYIWGKRLGEDYRFLHLKQAFRPSNRWSAAFAIERATAASMDESRNVLAPEGVTQVVLTTTYDVSQEKTISARLVREGDDTNAYAGYRQRVRRGMDLLVVLGDPNAPRWVSRLAVKAIWCY